MKQKTIKMNNSIRSKLSFRLLNTAVRLTRVTHKAGINTNGCFRTFTGKRFDILNPTFDMIEIDDIARGLAHKPHFSGFSPQFFSIAEHSLIVCKIYESHYPKDFKGQLQSLLHDASEAYTGDMIKPIKNLLPNFVLIENRLQAVIYAKYGINPVECKSEIKRIDNLTQDMEADAFFRFDELYEQHRTIIRHWIKYLSPTGAYHAFWEKYNSINSKINYSQIMS